MNPDDIKESFDMDSGVVSIDNDIPEIDDDELIQIHGRKFHIYDEESNEKFSAIKNQAGSKGV